VNTERLKSARKLKGLSLREASTLVGVSHEQISKYEKGIDNVSSEMLCKMAKAYGVNVDYFYQKTIDLKFGKIYYHNMPIWA
jgi:transcriptional regulator with XRE-family HTH domain